MKKKCLFTLFLSFCFLSQIALGDNCSIEAPNFTKTATEYQQVFEDLNRQIRYAKRNALLDSINDLGLDPKMIEFMSPFSIQVLSSKIDLSANEITQVANAGGYKPARRIGNLEIDQIVKRNLDKKDKTPLGVATFETEVSGVKIAVDYRDYSGGRFQSHPNIDMDGFPQKSKLGKIPSDQMITEALVKYKQANPDGIPLSQGNEPVFYRIISKGELEELLSTGQSRSNGSITDWASDFVNPAEKKWMLDNNISESSLRDLINFKNLKPDQIQKINSEFKAKFGRDLPKYFQTHDEIRISFVDNLLRGLSNDTNPRASHLKERLPDSTKRLIDRFTVNGQIDKAALGRYIEDNILSLPPGQEEMMLFWIFMVTIIQQGFMQITFLDLMNFPLLKELQLECQSQIF